MNNTVAIELDVRQAEDISMIIENVLFKNGYDIQYNEYLNNLNKIKTKLDIEILRSKKGDNNGNS